MTGCGYAESCEACRLSLPDNGCVLRFVDEHPEGASLPEIAHALGWSWQAVQQAEAEALSKLARRGAFLFRGHR